MHAIDSGATTRTATSDAQTDSGFDLARVAAMVLGTDRVGRRHRERKVYRGPDVNLSAPILHEVAVNTDT
jgi:hypothetical protein